MYFKETSLVPKILKDAFLIKIKDNFNKNQINIFDKGKNDLVTNCDLDVEKYIINKLQKHFKGDFYISEETNLNDLKNKRTWVLDPIDGTVNFANNIKLFGIQIALLIDKLPVFSVIYLPYFDEMYISEKGKGTKLNGNFINTSTQEDIHRSVLAFGDFSNRYPNNKIKQIYIFNKIFDSVRKVKMLGAGCLDFSLLASGKLEILIMFTNNLWDLMPGYLIALEAGAVSNYNNGS